MSLLLLNGAISLARHVLVLQVISLREVGQQRAASDVSGDCSQALGSADVSHAAARVLQGESQLGVPLSREERLQRLTASRSVPARRLLRSASSGTPHRCGLSTRFDATADGRRLKSLNVVQAKPCGCRSAWTALQAKDVVTVLVGSSVLQLRYSSAATRANSSITPGGVGQGSGCWPLTSAALPAAERLC